jgi:hypothetical protein
MSVRPWKRYTRCGAIDDPVVNRACGLLKLLGQYGVYVLQGSASQKPEPLCIQQLCLLASPTLQLSIYWSLTCLVSLATLQVRQALAQSL